MEIYMKPEPAFLRYKAREMIKDAGIENFSFDHDMLVMCGVRYVIEHCTCSDPDCGGVRLREADRGEIGPMLQ
jgi:hypothetical protein